MVHENDFCGYDTVKFEIIPQSPLRNVIKLGFSGMSISSRYKIWISRLKMFPVMQSNILSVKETRLYVKTYLRATIGQTRLNSAPVLHCHQDRADSLNIVNITRFCMRVWQSIKRFWKLRVNILVDFIRVFNNFVWFCFIHARLSIGLFVSLVSFWDKFLQL